MRLDHLEWTFFCCDSFTVHFGWLIFADLHCMHPGQQQYTFTLAQ